MDLTRQTDICSPALIGSVSVSIIGTGGIGAAAAIAIAKLGVGWIELYDDDVVDEVNIPTQMLRISDIGKPKVASVASLIKDLTDVTGKAVPRRVRPNTPLSPSHITVSALDSVNARKDVWKAVVNSAHGGGNGDWYLDARMGAEVFQLYTTRIGGEKWYGEALERLTEEGVPDEPCTAKATIYTAFIAAGHIAHMVKRIVMGDSIPRVVVHNIKDFQLTKVEEG